MTTLKDRIYHHIEKLAAVGKPRDGSPSIPSRSSSTEGSRIRARLHNQNQKDGGGGFGRYISTSPKARKLARPHVKPYIPAPTVGMRKPAGLPGAANPTTSRTDGTVPVVAARAVSRSNPVPPLGRGNVRPFANAKFGRGGAPIARRAARSDGTPDYRNKDSSSSRSRFMVMANKGSAGSAVDGKASKLGRSATASSKYKAKTFGPSPDGNRKWRSGVSGTPTPYTKAPGMVKKAAVPMPGEVTPVGLPGAVTSTTSSAKAGKRPGAKDGYRGLASGSSSPSWTSWGANASKAFRGRPSPTLGKTNVAPKNAVKPQSAKKLTPDPNRLGKGIAGLNSFTVKKGQGYNALARQFKHGMTGARLRKLMKGQTLHAGKTYNFTDKQMSGPSGQDAGFAGAGGLSAKALARSSASGARLRANRNKSPAQRNVSRQASAAVTNVTNTPKGKGSEATAKLYKYRRPAAPNKTFAPTPNAAHTVAANSSVGTAGGSFRVKPASRQVAGSGPVKAPSTSRNALRY